MHQNWLCDKSFVLFLTVLNHCEVHHISAVVYQCYSDVVGADSVTMETYKPVLTTLGKSIQVSSFNIWETFRKVSVAIKAMLVFVKLHLNYLQDMGSKVIKHREFLNVFSGLCQNGSENADEANSSVIFIYVRSLVVHYVFTFGVESWPVLL